MTEILNKALEYSAKYRLIGREHYLAADDCSRLNKLFGVPVIIIMSKSMVIEAKTGFPCLAK
ncbi:MAG: hypothetical protein ABSG78_21085 [Verrucomicrobiota bacterium]|jgi:hypothetical protein